MNLSAFLMCVPDFFSVQYVINPWMAGREGTVSADAAQTQWNTLRALLADELGAEVALMPPQEGLPDLVFTANAGLVRGRVCVPARFRCPERQGEEPHDIKWFAENGFQVALLPPDVVFEGAGDALFDLGPDAAGQAPLLWAASGVRSDAQAHAFLAETFGAEVVSLKLADPRFYHLDTCFCPLPEGCLLWYPPAFDSDSRAEVARRVPANRRLAISEAAACAFACNAVCVGKTVVTHTLPLEAGEELSGWLAAHGFALRMTLLGEFLKAGGSAKCLTLELAR